MVVFLSLNTPPVEKNAIDGQDANGADGEAAHHYPIHPPVADNHHLVMLRAGMVDLHESGRKEVLPVM